MILERAVTKLNNEIQLIGRRTLDKGGYILIIGVVHGDEPQGEFLINNYLQKNASFPPEFLFIPCLNPDGLANETRTNANGVDINRNFPTDNWMCGEKNRYFGGDTPASETETRFVIDVVEKYAPKLIITLHTPFKIVNFDGEGREISEKIGKIFNYPVEESIGYPTPGSFGTWAGVERKIPIITIEMDEEIPQEALTEPFEKMLTFLH